MSSISFGTGMIVISSNWSDFKTIVATKKLSMQYHNDGINVDIFATDRNIAYHVTLWNNAVPDGIISCGYTQEQNDLDLADFNNNFRSYSNLSTTKTDEAGRPIYVSLPRVGTEVIVATHNFCDPCTWYGDSARITNMILTSSVDHLTFSSGITNWIDMISGRVLNDDAEAEKQQALNPSSPHGYQVEVSVDGTVKTMREPFMTTGGDYEVIFEDGTVNFFSPVTGSVSASFSYANGSTWYLTPDVGKVIKIEAAEADFSSNIIMNDSIEYSFWGYALVFAPAYVQAGYLQPTDRVKLKAKTYKRYIQILQEAIGSYPTIARNASSDDHVNLTPKELRRKSRGVQTDSIAIPFRYATVSEIKSSIGLELRCKLVHDIPFGGEQGTTTFYCTVDDE